MFCNRCGGQGHTAANCALLPSQRHEKDGGKGGKVGGKGAGNEVKGKGEWPRDCFTNQQDEANKGRTGVGEVEQDIGGFGIDCVDRGAVPAEAADFQQVSRAEL